MFIRYKDHRREHMKKTVGVILVMTLVLFAFISCDTAGLIKRTIVVENESEIDITSVTITIKHMGVDDRSVQQEPVFIEAGSSMKFIQYIQESNDPDVYCEVRVNSYTDSNPYYDTIFFTFDRDSKEDVVLTVTLGESDISISGDGGGFEEMVP